MSLTLSDILERFERVLADGDAFVAACPCPTHGSDGEDRNPSCRIAHDPDTGKVMVRCRVGCPTKAILDAVNLTFADLDIGPLSPDDTPKIAKPVVTEDAYDLRDRVYRSLLLALPLAGSHLEQLANRGLSPAAIAIGGYRTITAAQQKEVAAKLYKTFGPDLYTVPGFLETLQGPSLLSHADGLLVPIWDHKRRVVALKVRKNNDADPKYMLLSTSRNSSGNPIHVPNYDPAAPMDTVRVTEGELKADVATHLSGLLTLSCPGVASWKPVLEVIRELKAKRVLVAYDCVDIKSKAGVGQQLESLMEALASEGYEVGVEEWADEHKGIDDCLAAGSLVSQHWGEAAKAVVKSWLAAAFAPVLCDVTLASEDRNPEPFPVDALPLPVRDFVEKTSAAMQVPCDFVGIASLVAAARAIGTTRRVQGWDKWDEYAVLYTVFIANPGSLKTAAMKRGLSPILARQAEISRKYNRREAKYKKYVKACKDAKAIGATPPPDVIHPPKPMEHMFTTNATLEALVQMLKENLSHWRRDSGLVFFSDELLGWTRLMNAYRSGRGADKQFFLSTWSAEEYKSDRKTGGETTVIQRPFICVIGSIQPEMLTELEDGHGREDGFFHRLLYSYPAEVAPFKPDLTRANIDPDAITPVSAAEELWHVVINRLLDGLKVEDGKAKYLKFSDAGWSAWVKWMVDHAEDTRLAEKENRRLKGPWAKLRAYAARFLLILHMLRVACGEVGSFAFDPVSQKHMVADDGLIDESDVANMNKLIHYFKQHYKETLRGLTFGPDDRRVEDFVAYVKERGGRITLRELPKSRRFGVKGKKDALMLARLAEDRGYGVVISGSDAAGKQQNYFMLTGAK